MRKDIDWIAMRTEYIAGKAGYQALAKKYGCAITTVRKKMVAEGWFAAKKEHMAEIADKKARKLVNEEVNKRERIFIVADKMLDIIEKGLADGTIPASGKGYRDVTGALKDIKDIKEIRSPLEEKEQLARIEKLRADAKRAKEIVGADITITLSPELEEYTQ